MNADASTVTNPDTPNATLSLHGEGVLPPNISVTPTQMSRRSTCPRRGPPRHVRNTGGQQSDVDILRWRRPWWWSRGTRRSELGHGVPRPAAWGIPGERGPGSLRLPLDGTSDEPERADLQLGRYHRRGPSPVGLAGDDRVSNSEFAGDETSRSMGRRTTVLRCARTGSSKRSPDRCSS